MKIIIDADALPSGIKDILFRASERNGIPLILVANKELKFPESPYISARVVPAGPDEADDHIAELVTAGDLVITGDIPLADRVVTRKGFVIDPRGGLYTEDNIKERLSLRDLLDNLRSSGIHTGGPSAFTVRDRHAFAAQLDRFLTKHKISLNKNAPL